MDETQCGCGSTDLGFDCVCDFVARNPGDIEFNCEWCGIYTASIPHCTSCETSNE